MISVTISNAFRKELQVRRVVVKELSLREAASQIGIGHTDLARVEQGYGLSIETYVKCCMWLGKQINEYVNVELSDGRICNLNHLEINQRVEKEEA